MSICDQLELASGAKVNRVSNEAMFFGNWANQSFIPLTIRTDYLKVLGIWFGGAGKNLGRSILPREQLKVNQMAVGLESHVDQAR
eukprot:g33234.t1